MHYNMGLSLAKVSIAHAPNQLMLQPFFFFFLHTLLGIRHMLVLPTLLHHMSYPSY